MLRVVGAIGAVTRLFALAFLPPALLALVYDAYDTAVGPWLVPRGLLVFLACAAAAAATGWGLQRLSGSDGGGLRDRDAYVVVGLGWLTLCLFAMLPFLLEGVMTSPVDAFFEAMSGLTTTGATVMLAELESAPRSLVAWRAILQFLGGMGIIVLSVAVLARLTPSGSRLMQAEAPGPDVERIAPRIAKTARLLWTVYLSLTAALFLAVLAELLRIGFGWYDGLYEALILTLTTISTGGFGAHADSIAYFHDGVLEGILIVFMLLSGMNYALHYHALRGRLSAFWRDPEWRFFLASTILATAAIAGLLVRGGSELASSLRGTAFTVASLITSTGFTTVDFDGWPAAAKLLILLIMVTGASAGSTGGGIKHVRVLLMLRMVGARMQQALHPRSVANVRLGNRVMHAPVLMRASAFVIAFIGMWIGATLLLVTTDPALANPLDAASASVSALSNMGPGFGAVGPSTDFFALTDLSKVVLALEMWFGRMELFTAFVLFSPETWRH